MPKNFNFCITSDATEERERGGGGEGEKGCTPARHMKTLPYKVTLNNTPKLRAAANSDRERGRVCGVTGRGKERAKEVVTPLKVCRNTTH